MIASVHSRQVILILPVNEPCNRVFHLSGYIFPQIHIYIFELMISTTAFSQQHSHSISQLNHLSQLTFRFQASSSNQEPIDIRLLRKISAVLTAHTATVQDAS